MESGAGLAMIELGLPRCTDLETTCPLKAVWTGKPEALEGRFEGVATQAWWRLN